jgi:hypothetical protein
MVDWTDEENDLIVADYFAMFRMVLSGATPNKSQHRRALLAQIKEINERTETSIERKHMNISGVLMGAGEIGSRIRTQCALPDVTGGRGRAVADFKPRHHAACRFRGTSGDIFH